MVFHVSLFSPGGEALVDGDPVTSPDLIIRRFGDSGPRLLFIEPYLTASHDALCAGLMARLPGRWTLIALAGRHFRWRMRGAASYLAWAARAELAGPWDGLLCSDMLDLAGLRGLAPELASVPAAVYFHENQLTYPAVGAADENQRRRDLYLAYCNLAAAQAARLVLFNSGYHREEFLAAAAELLGRLPDAVPKGLAEALAKKSVVLPVPIATDEAEGLARPERDGPLRILWNHRWQQDRDPAGFAGVLTALAGEGLAFKAAILGPPGEAGGGVFAGLAEALGQRLVHLGPVADRREYWRRLLWADVAVSSARQEYQGLSVAEAVWAGCRPLVPDGLVYPELYPAGCRYRPGELCDALRALIARPGVARGANFAATAAPMTWPALLPAWTATIEELVGA